MMGNSLLECVVFGRRAGTGSRGESERMSIDDDHRPRQHVVEDAAAHLYVWALKDIPQDLRDALARGARPRDVDDRASASSRRSTATSRSPTTRRTSSARTPASPSTRAASASTSRSTRPGSTTALRRRHGARDDRASAPLERGARADAREHRPEHRLPPADRALGVHRRTGTASTSKCVPKGSGSENMSFLKMCVPADGVDRDQAVRARVDRRRGRQAVPARASSASGSAAPPTTRCTSRRRRSRGRSARATPTRSSPQLEDELLRPAQRDRHRADGARRRRHRAPVPHRARRHAHDPEPRRGQLPVLGRAARVGAHRRRTAPSTSTGSSEMADHEVTFPITDPAGDPEAPRRRRGHRAGPHHRHPRPHADPHLRPGRRAADGPARRIPPPHGAERAQARRGRGTYEKVCIGTTTSARMVRFTERARRAVRRPRDLRQGRLPRRGDRADAAPRDGLLRDRRRRRGARDDADRGDRGGRSGRSSCPSASGSSASRTSAR